LPDCKAQLIVSVSPERFTNDKRQTHTGEPSMTELPFDRAQMRFLRAMAGALFDGFKDMAITPDQVVENMQTIFATIGGTKAKEISAQIDLAQLAMAPFFQWLPVGMRRRRVEKRMRDSSWHAFHDLARLRSVLYFCYYGHWLDGEDAAVDSHDALEGGQIANKDNPVLKQIGFTLPKYRERDTGCEVPLTRVPGRDIDPAHIIRGEVYPDDIDVIVVGSGSGGAVSALNLAKKHGYKVLIIEAGPFYPSTLITHEERRMAARLFKHGALQSTADNDFIVFQGRNVGGSPTINNGICLRMFGDPLNHAHAPNPLAKWRSIGVDIADADFARAYDEVQAYLGLSRIEPRSGRTNGPHLLNGWHAFAQGKSEDWIKGAKAGWFTKNYGPAGTTSACAYCGYCNTGCPYGRKQSMGQTYLPDVTAHHGARILCDTKVEEILWADSDDDGAARRATGVKIIDPDGQPHVIKAKKGVVVAAGTIASSLLLKRSDIDNDNIGHGISMNIASPVIALMPDRQTPAWDEDQMATVVDCGDFILESHFQPPLSMASLMPGWFEEMDRRMKQYGQLCSAGILFPGDRRGQLKGDKLDFKLTLDDIHVVRRAAATLTRVHFAAGAKEVWPALLKGQTLRPDDDIDAFFERAIGAADDITLSSSHPHGGNAINPDPALGVVDTDCRVHGTSNVLVTDASVFPSCIRVNAQFTTMALAQYATGNGDPFAGV